MLILVRHAPPFRRWHRRLGERLAAAGHTVTFEAVGRPVGRWLLAVERRLYRVVPDWDAPEPPPPTRAGAAELTIVLAGPPPESGLVVLIEVVRRVGELGWTAAARGGVAPLFQIYAGAVGSLRLLATGRPAIQDPLVAGRALEDLLPRIVTLLIQAVARLPDGSPAAQLPADVMPIVVPSSIAFLVRGFLRKIADRGRARRVHLDHWCIGLHRGGTAAPFQFPLDAVFRADPFLFAEAGKVWLFYEEYPYATGKGVIGRVAFDPIEPRPPCSDAEGAEGLPEDNAMARRAIEAFSPDHADQVSRARIVLEEPFHLSYPLVLRHAGSIYMLPETSAARRVRLYRADPFPDRWVPDAILIEDRTLADATPILHEGRWWLFAASSEDGGSSWDQLEIYHAPDLLGPWTPHRGNPVLIDACSARPAGRMWHENGALMRPAQDCRTGYGEGLRICRVDRLDEHGFAQTITAYHAAGGDPLKGPHTLNREGGWEVVDFKTTLRKARLSGS